MERKPIHADEPLYCPEVPLFMKPIPPKEEIRHQSPPPQECSVCNHKERQEVTFNGFAFSFCHQQVGADFKLNDRYNVVFMHSFVKNSFSGELRRMFVGKNSLNGFISTRLSTNKNLGLGIGVTGRHLFFGASPVFGFRTNLSSLSSLSSTHLRSSLSSLKIEPFYSLQLDFGNFGD